MRDDWRIARANWRNARGTNKLRVEDREQEGRPCNCLCGKTRFSCEQFLGMGHVHDLGGGWDVHSDVFVPTLARCRSGMPGRNGVERADVGRRRSCTRHKTQDTRHKARGTRHKGVEKGSDGMGRNARCWKLEDGCGWEHTWRLSRALRPERLCGSLGGK